MNSSVIIFPGSNCDRDMDVALKKFGFKNKMVWHDEIELPKSDLVVLPGGFSYGDYLRCGSIASKSNLTIKIGKQAFYKQLEMPLRKAYVYTSKMMTLNMMAMDAKEGISAFLEKRKPKWKNK